MREVLRLPSGCAGQVWLLEPRGRLHHWHHHDEPEFNLVLRGRARYLLADRRYDLDRHGLVWLFPRQEHLLVEMTPDFVCWIGVIRPAALRQAAAGEARYAGLGDADPPGGFCRSLAAGDAAFLDRLCRDLAAGDPVRRNAGLPYLFLTAWDRFAAAGAVTGEPMHPGLERALALLGRTPDADAGTVADAAGVSRWHLARLFRDGLGTSLTAWRARARIERVLALRRQRPRAGWLHLALEAGFGSYAQFHRTFTAIAGMTPRRWEDRPG
jgi:AraC-like DNA-binding protein